MNSYILQSLISKLSNLICVQETDHPPANSRKVFDNGLLLVLDSFDYRNTIQEVVPIRDYSKKDLLMPYVEDIDTLTELKMDDFRVLIHDAEDIPLFLGPSQTPYILSKPPFRESLRSYNIPIEVRKHILDIALQEKYSYYERKCRFRNELGDIQLSESYTKVT